MARLTIFICTKAQTYRPLIRMYQSPKAIFW